MNKRMRVLKTIIRWTIYMLIVSPMFLSPIIFNISEIQATGIQVFAIFYAWFCVIEVAMNLSKKFADWIFKGIDQSE